MCKRCEYCDDTRSDYYLVSDSENFKKDIGYLVILCDRCSVTTLFPGDTAYSLTRQEYERIKKKRSS